MTVTIDVHSLGLFVYSPSHLALPQVILPHGPGIALPVWTLAGSFRR